MSDAVRKGGVDETWHLNLALVGTSLGPETMVSKPIAQGVGDLPQPCLHDGTLSATVEFVLSCKGVLLILRLRQVICARGPGSAYPLRCSSSGANWSLLPPSISLRDLVK